MPDPNFIILYVDNPLRSADFYTRLQNLLFSHRRILPCSHWILE
ncbi:hypothetical protein GGI1_19649 [Acidithiobacillus sp. GGI-221]|nr:hypothetical protein GGI1_19649 [Acidithiobacillus sp. GGI-221]